MNISQVSIKDSLVSFIFVILAFTGGWVYLDQQRLAILESEKRAYKLRTEAELSFAKSLEREKWILEKESSINLSIEKYSEEIELNNLMMKYIDEFAGEDIGTICSDDIERNRKVYKARALLQLIEAKAKENGRTDILNTFVLRQKARTSGWTNVKCNPEAVTDSV